MMLNPKLGTAVLLLAVGGAASGQTVGLGSSWSEYDETNLQTLSGQSATGFTATHSAAATTGTERPRNYQEFGALSFSTLEVGNTIAMQFDVLFNTVPDSNDTDFRFGLFDTATNAGIVAMYDLGPNAGSSVRSRYDDDIYDDDADPAGPLAYIPGNWNDALEAGTTLGSTTGAPNSQAINDITTTHTFELLLTRTAGGFDVSHLWRNDAGAATGEIALAYSFDYAAAAGVYRQDPAIDSIDSVAFALMDNDPFGGAGNSGSYTTSNIAVKNLGVGDINQDGVNDSTDIDAMFDAIDDAAAFQTAAGLTDAQMSALVNVDGSGGITSADQTELVEVIFGTFFGDANLDGTVNGQDLAILAANFGDTSGAWQLGDFSGDDTVNGQDLAILAANFGSGGGVPLTQADLEAAGLGEYASIAIPEPGSLALLGLGGLALLRRRR